MRWCRPACPDLFPGPDELTLAGSTDRCNTFRELLRRRLIDQGYEFATSAHRDLKGQGRALPEGPLLAQSGHSAQTSVGSRELPVVSQH